VEEQPRSHGLREQKGPAKETEQSARVREEGNNSREGYWKRRMGIMAVGCRHPGDEAVNAAAELLSTRRGTSKIQRGRSLPSLLTPTVRR